MASYSDFNFCDITDSHILMTNYAGRSVVLTNEEFQSFINKEPQEHNKAILESNYFYSEDDREVFLHDYANAIRGYRDYLFAGTGLHIFVLTSYCNTKCVYCQASTCTVGNMMSNDTAEKCVDLALQSPNRYLSFEFQGGEPLANFETLKHIVNYTNANKKDKIISFNLVSNLTLLTEDMISFLTENDVSVSTSLDGPERLHNLNRPIPSQNSYKLWKEKIESLRKVTSCGIGAIQTTTKESLKFPKEIVDEYILNGFNRIFLRPLTPLGYAATRWDTIGYTAEEFIRFYEEAMDYILSKAKSGVAISEGHATIFLNKIINHRAGNYTELRSPCGAALGQLAYNYDGNIYTCDEGRMLAEMGDHSFQVGTVNSNYNELFDNPVCKSVATASCLENIPSCSDCVYSPYCGVCPVLNYYEYNNIFALSPNNYKCKIYKGILDYLFNKLYFGSSEEKDILCSWCK